MRRNMNKLVSRMIDNFMIKSGSTTIKKTEFGQEIDLFANLEEKKKVIGYLTTNGFDPFKRGTKEPQRINQALEVADWAVVQTAAPMGRSMWD